MDERGQITIAKSPSTPKDFAEGFFNALEVAAAKLALTLPQLMQNTQLLLHGTTVGTNAIVQLKGGKTGLITTRGHGDALIIMRSVGRSAGLPIEKLLHVSRHQKPTPIIPRTLIQEVSERIDWQGEVFLPLNVEEARSAVQSLLDQQVEAIAISFLWGFVNPSHELAVKQMVQEMAPGLFVTCAHELIAKPGEYERTAATAINCFIGPGSSGYIERVQERAKQLGYQFPLLIMQASGGVATAREAAEKPLFTIGSGPVGGIIGAKFLADTLGQQNVIASDVGGTSFDVGIIHDGQPLTSAETIIHQYAFFMPQLDIQSIGSGGGSLIWIDELSGTMKVGPQSAGADPGPACYNRGNEEPTITDANLILGYLNPDNFLGGQFTLDKKSSCRAMQRIADRLQMDVVEAASGAVQIVEFHMADLMRQMTVQRGLDPRDFVVYAYGGGGPVHAVSYARELGCQTVVIPLGSVASTWSALGIQSADVLHVYEKAELLIAPFDPQRMNAIFADLEARGKVQLKEDGIAEDAVRFHRSVDMKFRLQIHRVEVSVPGETLYANETEQLMHAFADKYEALYGKGSAFREAGMEIGVFRVTAVGVIPRPRLSYQSQKAADMAVISRDVYWRELKRFAVTPVYDGTKLAIGFNLEGPAIIEMPETTIVLHPQSAGQLDEYGNFVITIGEI
jgi:N-methylhydantoinase A